MRTIFSQEEINTRGLYMFATMSGAAIFIFVMGIGTVYSKNAAPVEFVRSGIRMVVYQYLNNLAYVAALFLPYPFVRGKLPETGMENRADRRNLLQGSFYIIADIYQNIMPCM